MEFGKERHSMIYKERITGIRDELKTLATAYREELRALPDGYLSINKKAPANYYIWQIPVTGRRKKLYRKGITSDPEMISKLLRKRYLKGATEKLEKDIALIEKILKGYEEFDEESVMRAYVSKHPDVNDKIFSGTSNFDEWAADYRKPVDFYEEGLKSTSASGDRMRSKGELIIASRLDLFKVPYRYEAPINHPDVTRIPDFTIKRPRDNKIIYWEHLGMMKNAGYRHGNFRKLQEYEDIGVTPWSNLILTYDQEDGGLDVRIIDGLIQGWLI